MFGSDAEELLNEHIRLSTQPAKPEGCRRKDGQAGRYAPGWRKIRELGKTQ
jgi:hypothetical protein